MTVPLSSELQRVIRDKFAIEELNYVTSGQDFVIFRGRSSAFGDVALRVPKSRFIDDVIDERIDAIALLRQEAAILRALSSAGIAVPQVFDFIETESSACLALEFLEGDGSRPESAEIGRMLRAVHDLEPPVTRTVAQVEPSLNRTLVTLINRRIERYERIAGCRIALPPPQSQLALLEGWQSRNSLLHMDVRAENFIAREGRVTAMLDWSNALVGPCWLDLFRAEEYGSIDAAFRQGYGEREERPPLAVELIYRLYTVVMLCLLFKVMVRDEKAASAAHQRLQVLAAQLREVL